MAYNYWLRTIVLTFVNALLPAKGSTTYCRKKFAISITTKTCNNNFYGQKKKTEFLSNSLDSLNMIYQF